MAQTLEKLLLIIKRELLSGIDVSDDNEIENSLSHTKEKSRQSHKGEHVVIDADDITDDMLDNVAVATSEKVYNSELGTSCHQCRQKTLDTKTNCRSTDCIGVRGQFCGPCLRNRYGEGVKESLLDPDWVCPPCRGICNCSFCRHRQGNNCTGIMIHEAKSCGFNSVSQYLASLETNSKLKRKQKE